MDYRQAIKSWKTANRLVPKNAHYLRQIAMAYEKMEDWLQAETYYQKALQLRSNDAQ
jgi:Flp pilus assembly protein TadD